MSTTVEMPPPVAVAKPLAQVAPKVPVYRRLDMRYVVNLRKLDPGATPPVDLSAQVQKLGQGVFVESQEVYAPGALVSFILKAPQHAEPYRADGVVRWLSDEPRGMGVQLFAVMLAKPGDEVVAPPQESPSPAASSNPSSPSEAPAKSGLRFTLPEPAGVADLLSGLLGKTIEARPAGRWEPAAGTPAMVAAFGPDDGPTSCLWVFDFTACIYAGGALTMMPVEEAKQALEAKELRDSFVENVREVFNVGASLFNAADGASVKMKDSYVTSGDMPDSVKQLMASTAGRLDLEIVVPDYGKGNVSVIVS